MVVECQLDRFVWVLQLSVANISLPIHHNHLPICCQYQSTNAPQPSTYLLPVSVYQYTTTIYLSVANISLPIHHSHLPICCQYQSNNAHSHLPICCQYQSTNTPQSSTYLLPVSVYQCPQPSTYLLPISVYQYTSTIYLSVANISLPIHHSHLPICCQYQSTNANSHLPICCQYQSTNTPQLSTCLSQTPNNLWTWQRHQKTQFNKINQSVCF
jgi:hypothetical protein